MTKPARLQRSRGLLDLLLQLLELAGPPAAAVHAGQARLQLVQLLAAAVLRQGGVHPLLQLIQLAVVLLQVLWCTCTPLLMLREELSSTGNVGLSYDSPLKAA